MTNPSFSIVVPTFRRPAALRETLSALLALDYDRDRFEVIVVDDDGDDDVTAEIVQQFRGNEVPLALATQQRLGAACARNRGARLAAGDLLLFCDDDIIVEPSHLSLHAAAREHRRDPIVNGAWEFTPAVLATLQATPFGRFRVELEQWFETEARGEPISGDAACLRMRLLGSWDLALRRDLFWQIGGFDEDFPVAGAEDQDFSLRAERAGALLLLDTKIRCFHNDDRLTLRAYCAREERSAQTMPFLARKYPAQYRETKYVRENRPITDGDSLRLVSKKAAKSFLASDWGLESLHRLTSFLEIVSAPEALLRKLYSLLLGLHLFRGFRRSWRS